MLCLWLVNEQAQGQIPLRHYNSSADSKQAVLTNLSSVFEHVGRRSHDVARVTTDEWTYHGPWPVLACFFLNPFLPFPSYPYPVIPVSRCISYLAYSLYSTLAYGTLDPIITLRGLK